MADLSSPSIPAGADAVNNIRPLSSSDIQAAKNSKKLDQTLQDFEGVYMSQMVSHMYEGVEVDPQFGGGVGEETMRSLLVNEYGKKMASAGGIGLAAAMKKQLLAAQEEAAAPKGLPVHGAQPAAAAVTETTSIDGAQNGRSSTE